MRANARLDVGALIAERIAGVDSNQSALGVHPVKGALRAAQHVYALHIIEMGVEGALAHHGDAIHIDSHSGRIDSRPDASRIERGGVARAIIGHDEIGRIGRQAAEVVNMETSHLRAGEHRAAERLPAQQKLFLGLCHHIDGIQIIDS